MGEREREREGGRESREGAGSMYPCRGNLPVRRRRCLVGLFLRS